jgi:hypothetical protein
MDCARAPSCYSYCELKKTLPFLIFLFSTPREYSFSSRLATELQNLVGSSFSVNTAAAVINFNLLKTMWMEVLFGSQFFSTNGSSFPKSLGNHWNVIIGKWMFEKCVVHSKYGWVIGEKSWYLIRWEWDRFLLCYILSFCVVADVNLCGNYIKHIECKTS